ncbi:glycosyltransferase [Nocardioides sp. Iso805N]|uniref:glycosyltransferase n=1 Tax=Nocardioides sp. Iso805N TaxID=1283287 RepID=UPI00037D2998|nr:glycosyltransferase [Nocardioides sp. Iso805N]
MIGWYVHHQGAGHLHRARAVQRVLDLPATVLSSLPRPEDWTGEWVQLERDDGDPAREPDAGGRLHWAPLHQRGLTTRMAQISAWLGSARPTLLVCDVSVEVCLLARLHGIPVLVVAMPGVRSDPAHLLGYDVATSVVGCWPVQARGLFESSPAVAGRLRLVGGLSRFSVVRPEPRRPGPPRVSVLLGTGGSDIDEVMIDQARTRSAGWDWTIMGRHVRQWHADPSESLRHADVVITQAGQNAVAEVAAARRPAIVIPARRPHDEQLRTAAALEQGPWPVSVRAEWPLQDWASLLHTTAALDGEAWASWCDGLAASRFAAIVEELAARFPDPSP